MRHSLRSRRRFATKFPLNIAAGDSWLFRSYDDLAVDLEDWATRLPPISAVCGIPRSGIVVAGQLATLMGIPAISLDSLKCGVRSWRPPTSKPLPAKRGMVLVVDDTCWSGGTIRQVREWLGDSASGCLFGSVYAQGGKEIDGLDFHGFDLTSINHCFAWNYLRDMHSGSTMTDMDGVLCADWTGKDDHEEGGEYASFLLNASPRVIPVYPVLGVVTGRVEKNREATEDWLARNGVRHHGLHMPFRDNDSRKGRCVGTEKAKIYAVEQRATLFVESDPRQSQVIFEKSRKPVLCTATMEILQ